VLLSCRVERTSRTVAELIATSAVVERRSGEVHLVFWCREFADCLECGRYNLTAERDATNARTEGTRGNATIL
jgi:hypothetical protein